MTILFIIGITLLALLALSLLARRFEKAANGLRWLARPFSIVGWVCLHGSLACKNHLESASEWPPKANVIARIVYLVMALFVYAGDFALARLRSAALFGVTAGKLAWLPLDTFSGLLWLCVSALWGIVLLDLIDLIPPGWRLLPVERLSKNVRLAATLLALVLFVVSALTMAYFVLWGQMQISEQVTSTTDTALLGLNISLVFGLLLGLASAVALWALFVGIAGVYTIFVALSYVVLRILALGLGIFGHSLDTAGDEYLKPVPFPLFHSQQNTPATTPLQSRGAIAGFLPEASGGQPPDTTPEEDPMTDKVVTRIHLDNFGFRFSPALDRAGEEVGAQRIVRLQAVADLSRPKGCTLRPGSQSIRDITPHGQINDIIKAGTPLEQAYSRIMHTIVESIVDSFTDAPVSNGHIVLATNLLLVPCFAEELQNLHRRLPFHPIILVSTLSAHVLSDRRWAEALESLCALWEEEVILNTLVIDERSALAKRAGEETQERFLAKFLASLLVCHEHSYYNPSFGQVFEWCSAVSPFTTLSFASAKVSSGKATPGQYLVNTLRSKEQAKVGKGDLNDCINQTINLFRKVCEPRSLTMAEEDVTIGDPLAFLVNEPVPLSDHQRFAEYRNAIQPVMTQTNPQAKLIVVRGSGTAETKDNPGYYIQVSALRPLLLTPPEAAHEVAASTPLAAEIVQPETAPVHVNGRRRQQSNVA